MFKKLTLILPALLLSIAVFSQSPIQIKDLKVREIKDTRKRMQQTETVEVSVVFKIADASQADLASICLGTSSGTCDMLDTQATFSGNSLVYQGQSVAVTNYETGIKLEMTRQEWESLRYAKVYVTSSDGGQSEELVFEK